MSKQIHKLSKGKISQLKGNDIVDAIHFFPNISEANYKKLNRAYMKGCGCRIQLGDEEMIGSGFLSKAKKVAKRIGKVAVKSGLADVVIDEGIGMLPLPQSAQNIASRYAKQELRDLTGAGMMKQIKKAGKTVGKFAVKSGIADKLIDEGLKKVANEKYANMIGNVAKEGVRDLAGAGMMKQMKKAGKKVGKFAVKSGIADKLIDEGLKQVANEKYANMIGNVAKEGVRDLTGGKINPYLPASISGAGLQKYGIPLRTYSDGSNLVRTDTDAFKPSVYNLPLYANPVGQALIRGQGFKVYM